MINVSGSLRLTSSSPNASLLDLPWDVSLEEWPESVLASLPRGISRHVVRFAWLDDTVIAVKETIGPIAEREYALLRKLRKLSLPVVRPLAVVHGRATPDGTELASALVTKHLKFSLPYRALFSQSLRENTAEKLVDALAVLLVRLHLAGFYWGDVSLSNTLFRRDAGSLAAYLVDAETGELHENLSDGQRDWDLELATTNIAGEAMDLQAADLLPPEFDPIDLGLRLRRRYDTLWHELTAEESISLSERWRVEARIKRLNDLGFDVGELTMTGTDGSGTFVIQPKIVDAGHHSRRLIRLTGLDVEEGQARRLLNDIDTCIAESGRSSKAEALIAHQWMQECFEPVVEAIPAELQGKLEPAQVYHEVMDHRWFLSESSGSDIGLAEAIQSYMTQVLPQKPDEWNLSGEWEEDEEDWVMMGGDNSEMTAADYF